MIKQLVAIFRSGLLVLSSYVAVILTILLITEKQPVQADVSSWPIVTTTADAHYLRLIDAPPQRDITKQRFAPLEARP
jgi:hypothetical protein